MTQQVPAPVEAEQSKAQSGQVGDGVYHVGSDIPAGRWRTSGPGGGDLGCYWARERNDSGDFAALITNGLVSGPTTVTVKSGEFLELSGGCSWSPSK
ncbi:hypothetical protein [Amycolatopsis sp. NPDC051903]|uniref:hypothetical protein n=1 Tax=Amycolatopsis sp. NPDC051903 TaxID=3363936 RepID=UPI0037A013A8